MQKKWVLLPENQEKSFELAKRLKISTPLAQIILNRNIDKPEEFLRPRLANLRDPFDLPNIKKAAKRVLTAIKNKENILVYGDYDVDGITSSVVVLETLQFLGAKPKHYIPYRYNEGYSLNIEAIKKAKEENTNLIITVDCGVSNLKEIEFANSLGIDVVVTDHHNIPKELPPAIAIVNPKLIKEDHPSKSLAGVGVAFKFVWALLRQAKIKDNLFLTDLLDLVTLGTIADVVPLTEENRVLSSAGLKILNKKKRLGIKHLVEAARVSGDVTIRHVNFAIAPRINAAGRLEHASISLNLLTAQSPDEAQSIAEQLNSINKDRQNIGSKIFDEAVAKIELEKLDDKKVLVLKGDNWHPGVIGIVASKLADKYYRPAILIGSKGEVGRGSARSVDEINIYQILLECQDLFTSFGGHACAAGFEINLDDYDSFCKTIEKKADQFLTPDKLKPHIIIDGNLQTENLTLNLAKEIDLLAPFGEGNEIPIFISKEMKLEELKKVGSNGLHLKARFNGIDTIGFGLGHLVESLSLSKRYDLLYNLECNEWNGFERVQLKLIDIKPS